MSRIRLSSLGLVALGVAASCSAIEPAKAPATEPAEAAVDPDAEREEKPPERVPIPTACATDQGSFCLPEADFVEALCRTTRPNVALRMFSRDAPWTRAYLRRPVEAWYVGSGWSSPSLLAGGEEVLVLAERQPDMGGMKVSGAGSYDVLRWDGSCVSVMSNEIAVRGRAAGQVATISWRDLNDDIRQALEQNRRVQLRRKEQRKACRQPGQAAQRRCEQARAALSREIGTYIRQGGELPWPEFL